MITHCRSTEPVKFNGIVGVGKPVVNVIVSVGSSVSVTVASTVVDIVEFTIPDDVDSSTVNEVEIPVSIDVEASSRVEESTLVVDTGTSVELVSFTVDMEVS